MSEQSYLDKLLGGAEVAWLPLGKIAEIGTGSHDTKDAIEDGDYTFYARGRAPLRLNAFDFDEVAIITAGDGVGVGKVFHYAQGKYALHQRAYRIVPKQGIEPRFIYHFMLSSFYTYIQKTSVHASVTSLRKPMFEKYLVPIPCPDDPSRSLEIQAEIVRVLDTLTSLTAELTAELSMRQKQYNHYRDQLLTFSEDEVVWLPLKEVAQKIYSGGTPKTNTPEYWENGNIPWMSSGEVNLRTVQKTEKYITESGLKNSSAKYVPKDSLVIALAGQGKTRGKVARTLIELTTNQSLAAITFDKNKANSNYVFHFLEMQYENLRQISSGNSGRGGLNLQMISNYKIPIPCPDDPSRSLEIQAEIVRVLDAFTSLTAELTAELSMRQKQYEYYRDLLLNFPKPQDASHD